MCIITLHHQICIQTLGSKKVRLSAYDLIGCCAECSLGCGIGGFVGRAWNYWITNGIVSGGTFNSSEVNLC